MARELRTVRFLALVDQLIPEVGSQTKVEKFLGIANGYISAIRSDTSRNIGSKTIDKVEKALRLRRSFFSYPDGDSPDYRGFIGPAAVDSHVEFEDRAAWLDVEAEGYVEEARRQGVEEEVIQGIRQIDLRGGITAEYLRQRLDLEMGRVRRMRRRGPELAPAREARLKREREQGD